MKDTITGTMLVLMMLAFFAICATWICIWDSTRQAAIEPTLGAIYKARIGPSDCLAPIARGGSGKRVVG